MEVIESKLKGVKVIKPLVFEDLRGEYIETFNKEDYSKAGIDIEFKEREFELLPRNKKYS